MCVCVCVHGFGGRGLTDEDGGEHEDEGVEDGDEGLGQGQDDLPHRRNLAEEPARGKYGSVDA